MQKQENKQENNLNNMLEPQTSKTKERMEKNVADLEQAIKNFAVKIVGKESDVSKPGDILY
jgi:hypothetical protein